MDISINPTVVENTHVAPANIPVDAARLQNELIKMVCRQTNYTYDEADDALKKHNNDYTVVIKEFMGIKDRIIAKRTTNQEMYKEIRNFMDVGSHQYYNKK